MRQYKVTRPNQADVSPISLFELSYYSESFGVTSEEFEQLTDMAPGETLTFADLTIERIDRPE